MVVQPYLGSQELLVRHIFHGLPLSQHFRYRHVVVIDQLSIIFVLPQKVYTLVKALLLTNSSDLGVIYTCGPYVRHMATHDHY